MELKKFLEEVLSRAARPLLRRRKKFLLPESASKCDELVAANKQIRRDLLKHFRARSHRLFAEALALRKEAEEHVTATHPTEAESELARRAAVKLCVDARRLNKEARAFTVAEIWLRLLWWRYPYRYDTASNEPPIFLASIVTAAEESTSD